MRFEIEVMSSGISEKRSSGSFFSELKRRRVVRTCILYILLCWGMLQVGDILFPAMGYDGDVASRYLLYAAILGFPLTFALAWFYQLSPEGIVRTRSFVERRVLTNIPPINERRHSGVSDYFRRGEEQQPFRWIITAETGPLRGLSFGVERNLLLGRSMESDIAIVSPHVSRQHARLELEDDLLYVEDLGSSNGTMVNGKRADARHPLRHEDELRFFDVIFRVTESFSLSRNEKSSLNQTTYIRPLKKPAESREKNT
jgi:hypothetical protein